MLKIDIPPGAQNIIKSLQDNGYEAYIVGGCVRDSLLNKKPKDWDICTSAPPSDIKRCMRYCTIDTGLQHGTITVIAEDDMYEVTTYRRDGSYTDNRHPDSVEFVTSLIDDLARRDFTINAMAYNETEGLIDEFGGTSDLSKRVITCVGNPDDRFSEDALRIMRALRFASTYSFDIQLETAMAIHRNKDKLNNIACERIQSELTRLLCGEGVLPVLLEFKDVIATIIPEISPCIGFDQNNKYHQYTIYDHIAHAVDNYKGSDISVKTALLLHDIGKPQCYSEDEKGGHFHGHSVPSRELAEVVLNRLRFDNDTKFAVLELVLYHDSYIEPTEKVVKRWLNRIGADRFSQLIEVKLADIAAHKEGTQTERIKWCHTLSQIASKVIAESQCFSIKDLEINGNDILSLGVKQGKIVGNTLRHILDKVISGEVENEYSALIDEAKIYLTLTAGISIDEKR